MERISATTESLRIGGQQVIVEGLGYSSIQMERPSSYKQLEELLGVDEQGVIGEAWSSFVIGVQNAGRNAIRSRIAKDIDDGKLPVIDGKVDVSHMAETLLKLGEEAMASYVSGERQRRSGKFGLKAAKAKFFDLPPEKQEEAMAILRDRRDEEAFIAFVKAA